MTSLFVCYEYKKIKKVYICHKRASLCDNSSCKKINITDLSAAATNGTMEHVP